jgi:hypothetical protein
MKKMEGRAWYWLKSLPGAKMGFLVCQPKSPIVWMDEQFKQTYKIPIRFSASVLEKSVFLASLNRTLGVLQIEDCWMYKGTNLRTKKFSERWRIVSKVLSYEYREDKVLQRGFEVQAATFFPLTGLREMVGSSMPPFVLAQGEDYSRRLRVQLVGKDQDSSSRPLFVEDSEVAVPAPTPSRAEKADMPVFPETPEGTAIAVPHEEYPDTYNLFIGGQKKGYAAVQELALSKKLRKAIAETPQLLVRIDWNEEFKMYVILSIA